MIRLLLAMVGGVVLTGVLGCMKVDATVPAHGGWGAPEPPAVITRANPSNKADLVRENTQLRDRLAWVEGQNRKLSNKYNEITDDITKARAKRDQYAAERDMYKGGRR